MKGIYNVYEDIIEAGFRLLAFEWIEKMDRVRFL